MKFFIKDFFSKCDQIRRNLWIWSHLLKKSLIKNFIFACAVIPYSGKKKAIKIDQNKNNCLAMEKLGIKIPFGFTIFHICIWWSNISDFNAIERLVCRSTFAFFLFQNLDLVVI